MDSNLLESQLRIKENGMLCFGLDILGWINIEEGEFHSALDAFHREININDEEAHSELNLEAVPATRMLAFFAADFSLAAGDFWRTLTLCRGLIERYWVF